MKTKIFFIVILFFPTALRSIAQVNYNLVCVDSIWYDTNPNFINVRIFNGDVGQLNYPSVQIISPANDTIGNPFNMVIFFAQLGSTYQTYTDTITQTGIPDFSGYTFLISENFGDTTVTISWCGPVDVRELTENEIRISPNPVHEKLYVTGDALYDIVAIEIYNMTGKLIFSLRLTANSPKQIALDASDFVSGIYFIRLYDGDNFFKAKFVKQ